MRIRRARNGRTTRCERTTAGSEEPAAVCVPAQSRAVLHRRFPRLSMRATSQAGNHDPRARIHALQRNRVKENEMKYVIAWTYRLNGSAAENDQSLRRGLVLFSKWKTPSGTTYHQFVGRADGGGGFAVIETDNPSDLTDATGKFGHLLEYQIYPVVDID